MGSTTEEHILKLRDNLSGKLGNINRQVDRLRVTTGKTQSSFNSLTRVATRAFAAIGAGVAVREIASVSAEVESLNNAIKFTSGSTEEYAKTQEFLASTTERLGLDLFSATQGFKTLSAGMIGTGINTEQTREIFEGVAVGLSAMGISADDARGAFIALSQVASKGKVQAEELRGQLGERIPGAFGIAARAMGKTTQQLDKMLEQGELLSEDFLPKFAAEVRRTFEGALPDAVNSARANFNRFSTAMLKVKLFFGRAVIPVLLRGIELFLKLIKVVQNNERIFKTLAIVVGIMVAGWLVYLTITKAVVAWTAILTAKQWLLNIALNANPVGLVVAALVALVAIVVVVTRHYDEWGAALALTLGPLGLIINLVESFRRNWEDVKKSFTSGRIIEGLKKIGAVLLDALLMPIQQLLELVSNIPGLGGLAGRGATNIQALRERLGVRTDTAAQVAAAGSGGPNSATGGVGGVGGVAGKGGKLGSGVAEVRSGAPKIININITKLVETLSFETNNLGETKQKIKEEVQRVLLNALNDAQTTAR